MFFSELFQIDLFIAQFRSKIRIFIVLKFKTRILRTILCSFVQLEFWHCHIFASIVFIVRNYKF